MAAAGQLPSRTAAPAAAVNETVSLNGVWQFRLDAAGAGVNERWYLPETPAVGWKPVVVPHTWQIAPESEEYMGVAWYRRGFDVPADWSSSAVRVEFEAVFHSAEVWVNGRFAGGHTGKGYTAFVLDVTHLVRPGARNFITVRVDNSFDERMLPRGKSSDWTHDGGVYRPVSLLVTPKTYIERVAIDAVPDLAAGTASVEVTVSVRNTSGQSAILRPGFRVVDEETGLTVLEHREARGTPVANAGSATIPLAATLKHPRLWHFDDPHLYRLVAEIEESGGGSHSYEETFGVRSFEVRDGGFYLNGERVRLMGVERMAGSNPEFGMAEPLEWIAHDHDDLKELNGVFTRVHWQQDRRLLDYCDRKGILIQIEVPTWGSGTFKGMEKEPSPEIMQNGLEQLREMIARDRNHPSVFAWGLCNEIGGQNPPAYEFARRMYEEAKRLDPRRVRTYASNSLQTAPERDVSRLMDFVEWNEYYESWFKGTPEDMRRNLDAIHRAFPGKPIVISEYGYCACTAERPEGDSRRIEILEAHNRIFREAPYVAGLIFFCYNDYRTHVGDKGTGVAKQRVHGVVDLYGARKRSFDVLRRESSPVESLNVKGGAGVFEVTVAARGTVPSYRLMGYKVRGVLYGEGDIPVERQEASLPALDPGGSARVALRFREKNPLRVRFDVLRPNGFSVTSFPWKPAL